MGYDYDYECIGKNALTQDCTWNKKKWLTHEAFIETCPFIYSHCDSTWFVVNDAIFLSSLPTHISPCSGLIPGRWLDQECRSLGFYILQKYTLSHMYFRSSRHNMSKQSIIMSNQPPGWKYTSADMHFKLSLCASLTTRLGWSALDMPIIASGFGFYDPLLESCMMGSSNTDGCSAWNVALLWELTRQLLLKSIPQFTNYL